jgi:hypothetical protein
MSPVIRFADNASEMGSGATSEPVLRMLLYSSVHVPELDRRRTRGPTLEVAQPGESPEARNAMVTTDGGHRLAVLEVSTSDGLRNPPAGHDVVATVSSAIGNGLAEEKLAYLTCPGSVQVTCIVLPPAARAGSAPKMPSGDEVQLALPELRTE